MTKIKNINYFLNPLSLRDISLNKGNFLASLFKGGCRSFSKTGGFYLEIRT